MRGCADRASAITYAQTGQIQDVLDAPPHRTDGRTYGRVVVGGPMTTRPSPMTSISVWGAQTAISADS